MRKQIIGGAILFASACGTTEPGGGGTTDAGTAEVDGLAEDGAGGSDATGSDAAAADVTTQDTTAQDAGAADAEPMDSVAVDSGPADTGAMDSSPQDSAMVDTADVTPPDANLTDMAAQDADPADAADTADTAAGDASKDTACDKPSEADAPGMIGTACAQAFQAVCNSKNQVIIMCQGGKWESWTGGMCGCFHTQCGPDQANCIAVGFVGIARAGAPRKAGRRLRAYA